MLEFLLQIFGQANNYSKFILSLGLIYPVCMAVLAYKIEKMFPDETKKPKSAATE